MTKLLIGEPPLQVLPSLAVKIGLHQALVLQQVHWLSLTEYAIIRDNRRWVRNTYQAWKERNFPFWDVSTIKRLFLELETEKLLDAAQFDLQRGYAGKAYAINYDELRKLELTTSHEGNSPSPSGQNDPIMKEESSEERERENSPFSSVVPGPFPETPETPSVRQIMANICQWGPVDAIVNFKRLRSLIETEAAFRKIKADLSLLPAWEHYWKNQDWRGKKGEAPSKPEMIYDTWPAFLAWRASTQPAAEPSKAKSGSCARCEGTGFRLSMPGDIRSAMVPCECKKPVKPQLQATISH